MSIEQEREKLFNLLFNNSFMYRDDPPFTLVSGVKSPYYFNCKTTTLDPEGCYLIGKLVYDKIKDMDVDAVGGLTLGADPISLSASLEAYRNNSRIMPLIIRKEAKKHGTQKWIEGRLEGVNKAAAIDDVITTGQSTIMAIERMRESGLAVEKAIVLIDREEGGRANIEAMGIEVVSLFKRSDFIKKVSG